MTDDARYRFAFVWESPYGHAVRLVERHVALGMSTKQAITHVTSTPARALGMADKIGDLKPGMLADIIAVEGNPLDDIKALGRVTFVMKDGKVFKVNSPGNSPGSNDRAR